jgi:hypothetical protein
MYRHTPRAAVPTVGVLLRVPVDTKTRIDAARGYRSLTSWCLEAIEKALPPPPKPKGKK